MHPAANVFHPLSPRLTVLLCALFTQAGEEDLYLVDFLSDDDAYLVRERAQALLEMDWRKRTAIVAGELRRQFQFRGLIGLDQVDPTWLLAAVRGEHPTTIGIVLAQLGTSTRSKILSQLPPEVADRVPTKDQLRGTRLEIMRVVRQLFESKFATMPMPPGEPTNFFFKDIVQLEGRELLQLVRALGLEELGAAFLTVGRRKLAELCQRLEVQAAEQLVAAVKQTEARDAMDISDANSFLQRMLIGVKLDEARGSMEEARDRFQKELFQKAGLFRLAKALRAERPLLVQQLAQRLPRSHGRLLRTYVDKMDDMVERDDAKIRRLQDLVLYRVEKLAARGKVNPRLLEFTFCYWGEEAEAEAAAGEPGYEEEGYEEGYE
jgi:hypothetical protein